MSLREQMIDAAVTEWRRRADAGVEDNERGHVEALLDAALAGREDVVEELVRALRLTAEYVGREALPAVEGWTWYDALCQYAPEVAEVFAAEQRRREEERERFVQNLMEGLAPSRDVAPDVEGGMRGHSIHGGWIDEVADFPAGLGDLPSLSGRVIRPKPHPEDEVDDIVSGITRIGGKYACLWCERTFYTRSGLARHIRKATLR